MSISLTSLLASRREICVCTAKGNYVKLNSNLKSRAKSGDSEALECVRALKVSEAFKLFKFREETSKVQSLTSTAFDIWEEKEREQEEKSLSLMSCLNGVGASRTSA